jgi:hypothetical protein
MELGMKKLKAPSPDKNAIEEFKWCAENNMYQLHKKQKKEIRVFIKNWLKESKNPKNDGWITLEINGKKIAFKNLKMQVLEGFSKNPFEHSLTLTFNFNKFMEKK